MKKVVLYLAMASLLVPVGLFAGQPGFHKALNLYAKNKVQVNLDRLEKEYNSVPTAENAEWVRKATGKTVQQLFGVPAAAPVRAAAEAGPVAVEDEGFLAGDFQGDLYERYNPKGKMNKAEKIKASLAEYQKRLEDAQQELNEAQTENAKREAQSAFDKARIDFDLKKGDIKRTLTSIYEKEKKATDAYYNLKRHQNRNQSFDNSDFDELDSF